MSLAFALCILPALCSLASRESPKVFLMLAGLQKFGKENRQWPRHWQCEWGAAAHPPFPEKMN